MIWKQKADLESINHRGKNTMLTLLDIEFIEAGDNYMIAKMPVDHRVHQPIGIMHGGASCVLAETVGSTAANFVVDQTKHYCVGLSINTNHIRSIKSGVIFAKAIPHHLGRSTQVWNIDITDENQKLISTTTLTMAVLNKA
ncbi:MAG TPA: hotdog fold thioesterase [Gammaproteobacteria bacterium]|nr:hotdog fold thioesterase [Gammaproteobacteria bacterium]